MPDQWSPVGALGQIDPNTYASESTDMLDLFNAHVKGAKPKISITDNKAERIKRAHTVE